MLDAYAVRKAIPRIVLAVIGINLSIYLCIAAVDIVNVASAGMASLLMAPFAVNGMNVFTVETDVANSIVAGAGAAIGTGPLIAATTVLFKTVAGGGIMAALGSMFFLLVPILLMALAVIITVVIRQALLFFLIVASPIAIACYILPGTEKYFMKWWDMFLKTLIVYPIIALIFALSDVFTSIIMTNNVGGLTGLANVVTGIVVMYAPLFMIPFAFKLAGGALAQVAGVASGLADKAGKSGFLKERKDFYGQRNKDNMLRKRAEAYRNAKSRAEQGGFRAIGAKRRMNALSGYQGNILDREAELNARMQEQQKKTTDNGDDTLYRAYTVNKDAADDEMKEAQKKDPNYKGGGATDKWKENEDGSISYKTAGGAWASAADVAQSKKKFGDRNITQFQQSMAYEMKKASTQEEQDNLVNSFATTAQNWGMSENEANGAWIGAGFANQDSNLQLKHARWEQTEDANGNKVFTSKDNGANIIKEMDEKKGSYQAAQNNADTWTTMSRTVQSAAKDRTDADRQLAKYANTTEATRTAEENAEFNKYTKQKAASEDTMQRARRVVDSIRTKQTPTDKDGNPIPGAQPQEIIGAGASGRTKEEMRAFAKITDSVAGEYRPQADLGTAGRLNPDGTPNRDYNGRDPDIPKGRIDDAANKRNRVQ